MRLIEFELDYPNFAETPAVAINRDHIVSIEPTFVTSPKDEYDATIITTTDGRTFQVAQPFSEMIERINR